MRFLTSLAAFTLVVGTAISARAQISASPQFRTVEPVVKRIVVEDEFAFTQRRYDPPVDFKAVDRASARDDTPEAATIALLSAMSRGDVPWFRSLWDAESARVLEADDKANGRNDASWVAIWQRAIGERRIVITNRIETGEYVLIAYDLVPLQANHKPEEVLHAETALKQHSGRWLATQELGSDPVLLYWRTPDVRTRRLVRGPRS